MLKTISALTLFISMIACGTPLDSSTIENNDVVNGTNVNAEEIQTQTRRQEISNPDEELTCMQQCGQEARGTVYADCLDDGGNREECGTTGRQWYRECLENNCDESAVQLDNCRTDCRTEGKSAQVECIAEDNSEIDCIQNRKIAVKTCIDECE